MLKGGGSLAALGLAMGAAIGLSGAGAAPHPVTYRSGVMTLTLTGRQASYGQIQRGTWKVRNKTYHVEGDWLPAGDAGGDLLRFYGPPWPKAQLVGIVGLATLYNTCNPDCATGRIYELAPVGAWRIPGAPKRGVHLILQP